MAKTIYAVSSGSYSDYRINALFSTRENAQAFIDAIQGQGREYPEDFNSIEEYELDPPTADLLKRGYSVWDVLMLRDGTVERVDRSDNSLYSVQDAPTYRIWGRTKAPAYKGTGTPDGLQAGVWAKSEKAAVKIVNEKRAEMIASGEWK